jgi:hypothetical protein
VGVVDVLDHLHERNPLLAGLRGMNYKASFTRQISECNFFGAENAPECEMRL